MIGLINFFLVALMIILHHKERKRDAKIIRNLSAARSKLVLTCEFLSNELLQKKEELEAMTGPRIGSDKITYGDN